MNATSSVPLELRTSPSSDAETAAAPSFWIRLIAVYCVLVVAIVPSNLPELMRATALPGSAILAFVSLPLYIVAVRNGLAPFRSGPTLALAGVMLALSPSMIWSEHLLDGAIKFSTIATALAWASLLSTWPILIVDLMYTGVAVSILGTAAAELNVPFITRPNSSFVIAALFAAVIRWRAVATSDNIVTRATRSIILVVLVGLVFISTFRAPTIGALLVLAFFAVTSREARFSLVIAAVAAGIFFSVASPQREPSYTTVVDRNDLVGRYETISEDRFSGRSNIWEGILEQAMEGPAWLFVGGGLGDVDFIVAEANPQIMSVSLRGQRVLSPHNQFLEILIAAGIPGVLALLWLIIALVVRLGQQSLDVGLVLCIVVLSGSNVPLIDPTGGALAVGMLCAHLGRRTVYWRRRAGG